MFLISWWIVFGYIFIINTLRWVAWGPGILIDNVDTDIIEDSNCLYAHSKAIPTRWPQSWCQENYGYMDASDELSSCHGNQTERQPSSATKQIFEEQRRSRSRKIS